jgi:hypothetical protein
MSADGKNDGGWWFFWFHSVYSAQAYWYLFRWMPYWYFIERELQDDTNFVSFSGEASEEPMLVVNDDEHNGGIAARAKHTTAGLELPQGISGSDRTVDELPLARQAVGLQNPLA